MKIISINSGTPQSYEFQGKSITTSFFKKPIQGPVEVDKVGIKGNQQADLRYHGGKNKALYIYDVAYYERWKKHQKREDWEYPMFGENLTTEGMTDEDIKLGNIYQAGTVVFQALQPRMPCTKLNLRFNNPEMYKLFFDFHCYGTYFSVLQEGQFEAGDAIILKEEAQNDVRISDIVECFMTKGSNQSMLQKILDISLFPDNLRVIFEKFRIEK